jgi:hypothetical protein
MEIDRKVITARTGQKVVAFSGQVWQDSRPFCAIMEGCLEPSGAMEIKLSKRALYSSRLFNEHRLRARRQADGGILPEAVTDVESPENCWERAGRRMRELDPDAQEGIALFNRYYQRKKS